MKTIRIAFHFMFVFTSIIAFGQVNCKVLKPEIDGSYAGDCKKGLANGTGLAIGTDRYEGQFIKGLPNGEGTYTWSAGQTYKGKWKDGKREGEGEYTFFYNGKDSTLYGNWLNDNYIGEISKNPIVNYKSGIDRYSITKAGDLKNRVLINIYQNGMRNTGISNLMVSSSNGYEVNVGLSIGYDEIIFPVKIKVTYTTMNKLKTASYYVEFDFEIFETGDWKVDLHN